MGIEPQDIQLVKDCLGGNSQAEYALYKKYGPSTFGICRRYTRDAMEAEDLHQLGWIKTFDKLKDYRKEGPFGAWLRVLFVSVCLNAYQKKKNEWKWLTFNVDLFESQELSDLKSPSDFLEMEHLTNLISGLPEGARLVFNMYAIEGMNHAEIAMKLSISEENSRQQLQRARQKLKRQLVFQKQLADPNFKKI